MLLVGPDLEPPECILAIRREKHAGHVSRARSDDWRLTLYCVVVELLKNDSDSGC